MKDRGTKIIMLCKHIKMTDIHQGGQYSVSSDLKEWQEIELDKAEFETMSFGIPESLRQGKNIYFKFTPQGESHVGGFALLP